MKSRLIQFVGSLAIFLSVVPSLLVAQRNNAQQQIGPLNVMPSVIRAGASTRVLFSIAINDPFVIATGVNLLRQKPDGSLEIVGVMHDDGIAGDVVASDGIFSLQVDVIEAAIGQVQYRASVALRGAPRRMASSYALLNVWLSIVDPSKNLEFQYPAGWSFNGYENNYTLGSTSTPGIKEGDPGSEIEVRVLPSNGATTLLAWLQDYYAGELVITQAMLTNVYSNPFGVTFTILEKLPGLSSNNASAFVLRSNGTVLQIEASPYSSVQSQFFGVLSSVH